MKRIFVTGGTGFFGKSLLAAHRGERELTVLSRDPEQFLTRHPEFANLSCVKWLKGDIRDFHFPTEKFDAILHGATPVDPKLEAERPEEMRSIILDGTRRVLEFARKSGAGRLLLISSGTAYGPQGCDRVDEEHPCRPVTVYGKGKLESEKLCLDSGVDTVIARCFAFLGSYLPLDGHFAAGNFVRDALRASPIQISGDGSPLRAYLDATDLVRYLWKLLDAGKPGRVYNVGGEQVVSIAELAQHCAALRDPALAIHIAEVPGKGPVSRYVPDVGRIRDEFGLTPAVSLAMALRAMFEFHRMKNPGGF